MPDTSLNEPMVARAADAQAGRIGTLLALADEAIEQTFRSAAVGGRKVSLWVIHVNLGAGLDVRFTPGSDRIAASRQPSDHREAGHRRAV